MSNRAPRHVAATRIPIAAALILVAACDGTPGDQAPCEPSRCGAPPPRICLDGATVRVFSPQGTCEAGACAYAAEDLACPGGCAEGACVDDLCLGLDCSTPPPTTCGEDGSLVTFDSEGTCEAGACAYPRTVTPCARGCEAGACLPDPCADLVCDAPPARVCVDADTLRYFASRGTCEAGTCSYPSEDVTCPNGCANDACVGDPCIGLACDQPPSDSCLDDDTLRTWSPDGVCDAGSCDFSSEDVTCPDGCAASACIPDITDPNGCAGVACDTPPPATCDGDRRVTYAATGRCEFGACIYAATSTPCAFGCSDGTCRSDACDGVVCDSPPEPTCVDAETLRTFAPSGSCASGACDYAPEDVVCPLGCHEDRCRPWRAQMVTAGAAHACALVANGRIVCWGDNRRGQTGLAPSAGATQAPRLVGGEDFQGFTHVAAGAEHTCAIRAGLVHCWGDNRRRQLGRDTVEGFDPNPGLLPEQRFGNAHWLGLRVSAGALHTCVNASFESRTLSGTTPLPNRSVCWGDNTLGQLGRTSTSSDPQAPGIVVTTLGFTLEGVYGQIEAADAHTCTFIDRVTVGGAEEQVLACWGANGEGQIDSPSSSALGARGSYVFGSWVPHFLVLGAGGESTCFSRTVTPPSGRRDEVVCRGALPFGVGGSSSSWVVAGPWVDAGDVIVAPDFLCVVRDGTGAVECLGEPATTGLHPGTPTVIAGFTGGARWLTAGADFACAIGATDDVVRCWGKNDHGQLGSHGPASDLMARPIGP